MSILQQRFRSGVRWEDSVFRMAVDSSPSTEGCSTWVISLEPDYIGLFSWPSIRPLQLKILWYWVRDFLNVRYRSGIMVWTTSGQFSTSEVFRGYYSAPGLRYASFMYILLFTFYAVKVCNLILGCNEWSLISAWIYRGKNIGICFFSSQELKNLSYVRI